MKRLALCLLILACAAQSGCSLCCTPWDYAYPGYGGKTPRDNRFSGRVGSAFDPAGATPGIIRPYGYEQSAPAEETPAPEPEKMEEGTTEEGKTL